jgi:hypothetical protein
MRLFKSDWVDWVLTTLKVPDDVPIENKRVTNAIASAQAQVRQLVVRDDHDWQLTAIERFPPILLHGVTM